MRLGAAFVVSAMLLSPSVRPDGLPNTFEFLAPTIQLSDEDKDALDKREVIVRILPASGHELAALAAASVTVGPDALVESTQRITELKRGPLVPQIGRFSAEPRLEDLRQLTLDDADVRTIRRCDPENCGLKLTPEEIRRLQRALSADKTDPKAGLDAEFRHIVLERTKNYLHSGAKNAEFSTLVRRSPYIQSRTPQVVTYLDNYPAAKLADAESFLYWSKEEYAWKPMITVTHVTIVRHKSEPGWPEVMVVSRDIFATRYTSASFVLTMLFQDTESPSRRYLVYINRTWVDGVRALWRPFVEHRIKGQAKKIFAGVRDRIERSASLSAADP